MTKKPSALALNVQHGMFSREEFEALLQVIQHYDIEAVKITSGQRLTLFGIPDGQLSAIEDELQTLARPARDNGITYVQSCLGLDWCEFGIHDAHDLGRRIESLVLQKPLTAKVKVAIAGCHRCCTTPYVRDLGIIAEPKGWKLIFGGHAGNRPRIGDVVADGLSDDQVVQLSRKCFEVYQEYAKPQMRTARFMEYFGAEPFMHKVLSQQL